MGYKGIPGLIIVSAVLLLSLTGCGLLTASEPTPTPKGKWADPELGRRLEKMEIQSPAEAAVQAAIEAAVQATVEARTGKPSEIDAVTRLRGYFKQQWMEAFDCQAIRIYGGSEILQCSINPSVESTYPDGTYIPREQGEMSAESRGNGTWLITVNTLSGDEEWVLADSELPHQRESAGNGVLFDSAYPVSPGVVSGTYVTGQVKDNVSGIWCKTALQAQCP